MTSSSTGSDIIPQSTAELKALLGQNVVFLPCSQGEGGKGPIIRGFQRLTPADMTPEHLAQCEDPEYRIGVLLGANSGGLCAIDCDTDEFGDEMLRLNPWLSQTLGTTCNRGKTFWLRIIGAWPKKADLFWRGFKVGEWRADNHQCVIAGVDKNTGKPRRFISRFPVLPIPWQVITWPAQMCAGSDKNPRPWPGEQSPFVPPVEPVVYHLKESNTVSGRRTREKDVERVIRSTSMTSRARSTSTDRKKERRPGQEKEEIREKQERLYREKVSHLTAEPGQRNAMLTQAVPYLLHVVSESLVVKFLLRHYDEKGKPAGWDESREGHEAKIRSLIAGCLETYPDKLPASLLRIYTRLDSENDRSAFRICLDLARYNDVTRNCPPGEFILSYGDLAARLDISKGSAEKILKKDFQSLKIVVIHTKGQQRVIHGGAAKGTKWTFIPPLPPRKPASNSNEPF